MALFPRASGILLHPTSLPGRYGIGDMGAWACRFVDYLQANQQRLWQMLPLGPTSYGDSPYQALSAFAGNPLLISLDKLVEEGWLLPEDVQDVPAFSEYQVDYGAVIPYHTELLSRAFAGFREKAAYPQQKAFQDWSKTNRMWLDDFALFTALKSAYGGAPWVEWDEPMVLRDDAAIYEARAQHADAILSHKWNQWMFFRQWAELKAYANNKGVRLIGDIPIFVAHDSADVWANPTYFSLDEKGYPTVIAGVPPDYFSETGQRWGNPLYKWTAMAEDGYGWWVRRFRAALAVVDIVRIDHFRGFEAYWEVPASETTAIQGQWVPGPGIPFFNVMQAALGSLPIIAEDLGVITPEVEALRDGLGLPGMKVLQFAWGDFTGKEPFLPHHHVPNAVVYSGTHDNNTTVGWWQEEATEAMRDHIRQYLDHEVGEINWELIQLGMASPAHTFIAPMQDILGFGSDTRMNMPGRESGNWSWRALPTDFENPVIAKFAHYTYIYGRASATV